MDCRLLAGAPFATDQDLLAAWEAPALAGSRAGMAYADAESGRWGSEDPLIPRIGSDDDLNQRRGTIRFGALSASQNDLEERLRTVCLVICAMGVVSFGLAKLKFALVPLVLSMSLKYLLQPMIDALTRKHTRYDDDEAKWEEWCKKSGKFGVVVARCRRSCRRVALPHWLAVLVSLLVALAFLGGVCAVVTESVRDFTSRADVYADQVQNFLVHIVRWMDRQGIDRKWRKSQSLEKVADKLELSTWVTATVFGLGEGRRGRRR